MVHCSSFELLFQLTSKQLLVFHSSVGAGTSSSFVLPKETTFGIINYFKITNLFKHFLNVLVEQLGGTSAERNMIKHARYQVFLVCFM